MLRARRSGGATIVFLLLIGSAAVGIGTGSASAQAAPNTSAWVTTRVPGTTISVKYPTGWLKVKEKSKVKNVKNLLTVRYTQGGNNSAVLVARRTGPKANWLGDFALWDSEVRTIAKNQGNGVLSTKETVVGNMPAHEFIDSEIVRGGQQILVGLMEMREPDKSTIAVTVGALDSTPDALLTVQAILDSVSAKA
jgi:hypothetical protein